MTHFSRTRHFIRYQGVRQRLGVVVALLTLFGAWAAWLFRGTMALHVVSESARIEVQDLPVQVQVPIEGQVSEANVQLGRYVERGDVIVQLDATSLRLRRDELQVAIRTGAMALDALRAEFDAEQRVRGAVAQMARQTTRTAKARVSLDEKALQFKEKESQIDAKLHQETLISSLDALRSAADAETQRARVLATSAQAALDAAATTTSLREREARLAAVQLNIAQAQAEVEKWQAQVHTLDHEIARRTVRAPVAGVLADVMTVSVGMTLTSDERVATIVSPGALRVVASFSPQQSVGRLRPGQKATLRFDSYPWAQFGTVSATTTAIALEPRDGLIRAELSIVAPNPAIPLEHGLTGSCEVEVEVTTPLKMLLRSVARSVTGTPDDGRITT